MSRPELEAFVDGVVRRAMTRDHIAGVTISVVQDGQVVLKKGYGFANLGQRKAVDPDKTLFRVASISKTFTWIALMNEIESGHMRLDGPVNLYLPEPLQLKDQGKKTQVRLRDLMTHTGGFEDRALGQLFERDPNRVRPWPTICARSVRAGCASRACCPAIPTMARPWPGPLSPTSPASPTNSWSPTRSSCRPAWLTRHSVKRVRGATACPRR
jgi:CubicO group peptidase (beta-lactamase class C family)